ncbi:hypothetical protein CGLO_09880 [Colletotrichum gloeosporioides Cg-14]|uniref:Uncharacterized protein n=1 Tax=Colletotrichum gloeosporioides (strain Cg-14) TaxID=1237896 RepID=T0KCH9_COLGC|nr:hypothetical protein CGLO_09880 [Colletotrichum gloeosporioides Cg-14]
MGPNTDRKRETAAYKPALFPAGSKSSVPTDSSPFSCLLTRFKSVPYPLIIQSNKRREAAALMGDDLDPRLPKSNIGIIDSKVAPLLLSPWFSTDEPTSGGGQGDGYWITSSPTRIQMNAVKAGFNPSGHAQKTLLDGGIQCAVRWGRRRRV